MRYSFCLSVDVLCTIESKLALLRTCSIICCCVDTITFGLGIMTTAVAITVAATDTSVCTGSMFFCSSVDMMGNFENKYRQWFQQTDSQYIE